MSKPDRPITHPDDYRDSLGYLVLGLLGLPSLFFLGLVFLMPALSVLVIAMPKILSGESSIDLGGTLLLIITLIIAWGGVTLIRADLANRRR